MQTTWLSLLPPIIALTCVFVTKCLISSLLIGIGAAALIAKDFSPLPSAHLALQSLYEHITDPATLLIFGFSLAIGLLIVIMNQTGCALAFTKAVTKHIKNPIHAQAMSLILSFALFIDDYLSNLTVGYVIRPLTDLFKIPRAKLAFLVHSLSGPFVILVPISSWGAIILLAFTNSHIDAVASSSTSVLAAPFSLYLHTLPFIFYSILTIIGVWYIVLRKISFGPMHTHEKLATEKGDFFGGVTPAQEPITTTSTGQSSIADFIVPLSTLIICIVGGMRFYQPVGAKPTFLILCVSAVIAVIVALARALYAKSITINRIPGLIIESVKLMYGALFIVMLAMTLGDMLDTELHVGQYLATLLLGTQSIAFLPLIFFIVATTVSVLLGSAWGTIILLTPIAVPMVIGLSASPIPATLATVPLLIPVLAAVLSGAVAGNHVSPISDTTILAATSSGSSPLAHAYTQFPYTIPMFIGSGTAFLAAGILAPKGLFLAWAISITLGLLCTLGLLSFMHYVQSKKKRI